MNRIMEKIIEKKVKFYHQILTKLWIKVRVKVQINKTYKNLLVKLQKIVKIIIKKTIPNDNSKTSM